jgi:AMP nucleosidase
LSNHHTQRALWLESDQQLISTGVKAEKSDQHVTETVVEEQVKIVRQSLSSIMNNGSTIKHLRFDW